MASLGQNAVLNGIVFRSTQDVPGLVEEDETAPGELRSLDVDQLRESRVLVSPSQLRAAFERSGKRIEDMPDVLQRRLRAGDEMCFGIPIEHCRPVELQLVQKGAML